MEPQSDSDISTDPSDYSDLDYDTDHLSTCSSPSNNTHTTPSSTPSLIQKSNKSTVATTSCIKNSKMMVKNLNTEQNEQETMECNKNIKIKRSKMKKEDKMDVMEESESDYDEEINIDNKPLKRSRFSQKNHNKNTRNDSFKFKRCDLNKLCLDELLAKTMSFYPDLPWNTNNEWCRYCGSRASHSFLASPWGSKQLCYIHHTMWKIKKLDLSQFDEPKDIESAINKKECTEKQYLIDMLMEINVNGINGINVINRRSLRRHKNNIKIEDILSNESEDEYSDFAVLNESESEYSISNDSGSDISEYSAIDNMDDNTTTNILKLEHGSTDNAPNASIMDIYNKLFNSSKDIKNSSNLKLETSRKDIKNIRNLKLETSISRDIKIKSDMKDKKSNKLFDHYQCKSCDEIFYSPSLFREHSLKIHGIERAFECIECDKTYVDQNGLDVHIRKIHNKEINFRCNQCQRPFFAKSEWKNHSKICISKYWLIDCALCDESFEADIQWKRHMNTAHNIPQPYQCLKCLPKNVKYTNKTGLQQHIKKHHEKLRPFKCKLCPKEFFTKLMLENHQRVHDGKKPYQCKHCKMRFTQKCSLRCHIKNIHLKIRRFGCVYCGKRFAEKTGLRSHAAAVHDDVISARFECDICHKKWYEKGTYYKHIKNAHKPKDPIKEMIKNGQCPYPECDKKYYSKNCAESVKYHLVNTHKDKKYAKYKCKKCKKLFYDKTSHTEHMEKKH